METGRSGTEAHGQRRRALADGVAQLQAADGAVAVEDGHLGVVAEKLARTAGGEDLAGRARDIAELCVVEDEAEVHASEGRGLQVPASRLEQRRTLSNADDDVGVLKCCPLVVDVVHLQQGVGADFKRRVARITAETKGEAPVGEGHVVADHETLALAADVDVLGPQPRGRSGEGEQGVRAADAVDDGAACRCVADNRVVEEKAVADAGGGNRAAAESRIREGRRAVRGTHRQAGADGGSRIGADRVAAPAAHADGAGLARRLDALAEDKPVARAGEVEILHVGLRAWPREGEEIAIALKVVDECVACGIVADDGVVEEVDAVGPVQDELPEEVGVGEGHRVVLPAYSEFVAEVGAGFEDVVAILRGAVPAEVEGGAVAVEGAAVGKAHGHVGGAA